MKERSENQKRFVEDAMSQGYEVYDYSGRGMFGETCPAITVECLDDLKTTANYYTDNMGLDYVLYARN